MSWRKRFPLWDGPSKDWPYPFPPIRGAHDRGSGEHVAFANETEHTGWHADLGEDFGAPAAEQADPVRGVATETLITTENSGQFNNRFEVGTRISFLVDPTTGDRITPLHQITVDSLPQLSESGAVAPPPPTVQIPGPNVDVGPGVGTPTTTTVEVTGQGFEVRDPATGAVTIYPIGTDGLPVLAAGVQVIGPQVQASGGAAPVRVNSFVENGVLITTDPFTGDIISQQTLPPEQLSPFQNAQIAQSNRAAREQERSNLAGEFFNAQDFGLAVQTFNRDTDTIMRQLRQTDENIQLRRDELLELNRANRTNEALRVRQQIEVEGENQRNFQINLGNLQARGNELIAQIQTANADRALQGAIAGANVAGQNADRLFAAAESQLNRSMQLLNMGLQDEQTRTAQRIQILDLAADAAQSPFDVVRQAAISSGLGGISGALARGESGLTEQGVAPLSGLLSEFQGLSRPSPLLSGPLAQMAQQQAVAPQVGLPQLPAPVGAPAPFAPAPFSGAGVLAGPQAESPGQAAARLAFEAAVAAPGGSGTTTRLRDDGSGIQDRFSTDGTFLGSFNADGTFVPVQPLDVTTADPVPLPADPNASPPLAEPLPALAAGGTTKSPVALTGEDGPELIFDLDGEGFFVLNAEETKKLNLTGVPKAADGGIFGSTFESAAGSATSGFDLLSFLRKQLFERTQKAGLPFTGRSGPIDVAAPGTRREPRELLAGLQASAGINPRSFLEEIPRLTPPALAGGRQLRRTR